jgi:hypothetical protein
MSYLQIEYKGEQLGFKFNELAVRKYSEIILQDLSLGLTESELKTSAVYAMVFAGLYGNFYAKRVVMPYTFEQCIDIAEGLKIEDVKALSEVLTEVQSYKDWIKNLKEATAPIEKKNNRKQKVK